MRRIPVAALAMCTMIACQPSGEPTEVQRHEIEAEVNMALDSWWENWRSADVGLGLALVEDSPEAMFAGTEGEFVIGHQAMVRQWTPFFDTISSQMIDIAETRVKVITMDAAYAMQRGTYSQTDTSGVTGPTFPFAYSYLMVRTEAGWRITAAHASQGQGDPEIE